MDDLIKRSDVLPALVNYCEGYLMYCDWHDHKYDCAEAISQIPAVDAVPVLHYSDTGSTVIKAEDINEWQDRIIIDDGKSHSCAIYYKENENTVDVVRCKDCKHAVRSRREGILKCDQREYDYSPDDGYCFMGEQRGEEDE